MIVEAITLIKGGSKNVFQSNKLNDGTLRSLLRNALSKPIERLSFHGGGGGGWWLLKLGRVKELAVTHTQCAKIAKMREESNRLQ